LVQPLNKGFIKNLVAVASSNLNVALEDSAIRQMAQRTLPHATRGGQGIHHQGGPGLTRSHQGGSPHDCLARGVNALWGRNSIDDDGECVLRKSAPGLLGDLGV
jgi:hypothetical protein